jgi:hypothetical protein
MKIFNFQLANHYIHKNRCILATPILFQVHFFQYNIISECIPQDFAHFIGHQVHLLQRGIRGYFPVGKAAKTLHSAKVKKCVEHTSTLL